MKGKNVVITGGAGFIGSHLAERLAFGNDVTVIDDFSSGSARNLSGFSNKIKIIKKDISKSGPIKKELRGCDVLFHLAANPDVALSGLNNNLHLRSDVVGTYNVLEAARLNHVKTVVFTSSSTVYGRAEEMPIKEEYGPLFPISFYGASKLACESYMYAFAANYGIRTISLRLANIIGPRNKRGVVYKFVEQIKRNKPLTIFSDGRQRKPYTYVDDCISALLISESKSKGTCQVYNVASKDTLTVNDIAAIISHETGVKARQEHSQNWIGDVEHYELDTGKLRKLGWRPKYGSLEAIRLTIRHLL